MPLRCPLPSRLKRSPGGELVLLGRAEDVRIEYFAISVERRLTHPCVLAISEAARAGLGALEHDAGVPPAR